MADVKVNGHIEEDELGRPVLIWEAVARDGRLLGAGVLIEPTDDSEIEFDCPS